MKTLEQIGTDWAMSYINSGCDEAMIDLGDNSALEDCILTAGEEHRELIKDNMSDIESAAKETFENNGWIAKSEYCFVPLDIANGERF
jgi:hypothetical protein